MTDAEADGHGREDADFHQSWVAALAELELDVARAESLLRANTVELPELLPWVPPTGIGTLPLPLLDRARRLHQRQLEVAERLVAAIEGNRRQVAVTEAIDATRPASPPVFVDHAY